MQPRGDVHREHGQARRPHDLHRGGVGPAQLAVEPRAQERVYEDVEGAEVQIPRGAGRCHGLAHGLVGSTRVALQATRIPGHDHLDL
jgi:hypothetical protein